MNFTLLILAGGLGSRFNGAKQLHGIGPNGELLMEYSIYDAINEGCSKIVILANQECIPKLQLKLNYLDSKVDIHFVDQYKFDPNYPNYRKRPWGTGHAVLSCEGLIENSFVIINADDFYGRQSYTKSKKLLNQVDSANYGMVTYQLGNTLSDFGGVSRGICEVKEDLLYSIKEYTNIELKNNQLICNENECNLDKSQLVSMNMWVLEKSIFNHLHTFFDSFYKRNHQDEQAELYLPSVINKLILNGAVSVKHSNTECKWFGLTYSKDLSSASSILNTYIASGSYPNCLNS